MRENIVKRKEKIASKSTYFSAQSEPVYDPSNKGKKTVSKDVANTSGAPEMNNNKSSGDKRRLNSSVITPGPSRPPKVSKNVNK